MTKEKFDLEKVLDLNKWQVLQDKIALACHLAIILVDYKGQPVTKHSEVKPFCQLVRQDKKLSTYCEKCDARGGVEAVRTGKPFMYRCHFNIIDMAIPIMINEQYVGAIMAGEILAKDQDSLEQILNLDDQKEIAALKNKYQDLIANYPLFTLKELTHLSEMLEKLAEYIISESLKKDLLLTKYQDTLRISPKGATLDDVNLAFFKEDYRLTILEKRLNERGIYQAKNPLLQPAIDAVFLNKDQHLDLTFLAQLVNLTPTYLSRLFKEEFQEPFSHIYNKLKIYWAKDLLLNSQLSITEISDALGFIEASYFIRLFKKITGTTPKKWQNHYQK